MLPSLYSPKNRTVESTVGGGGGLPGVGMRLEAVRAVDGLADGWGTEEAVRRADGPEDVRHGLARSGRRVDGRSGRRGRTAGADGRAVGSSDGQGGRPGHTAGLS